MNPILIALVMVMVMPLFVASWRLSLAGLAGQGLLIGWIRYQLDPHLGTASAWIDLFDLVAVRGLAAPLALYVVARAQWARSRDDVLPPNLMSWALAVMFVLFAFRFADLLVPAGGTEHELVATATAGVLLGLLVLSTQTGPFSQMIGAIRIENAIAVLELSQRHEGDPALRLAQTALVIGTVLMFRWYLRTLPRAAAVTSPTVAGMGP